MYANALAASKQILNHKGLKVQVSNASILKPLSQLIIKLAANDTKLIITIEEHSKIGGLGSAIAELLAGMRQHPPLVRLGTGDCYPTTAMSYEELLKFHHLDVDSIVQGVLDALR